MGDFLKYPRTVHIVGSSIQKGDEDMDSIHINDLKNLHLIIEEKVDGANSGISFDGEDLKIQSRGHILLGGPRERQFNLLKSWANSHQDALYCILGERYIMYGEWLYAKHTEFYDELPHYFMEFDIYDRDIKSFLSTKKRHDMLEGSPVTSVPVLHDGTINNTDELQCLIKDSLYKSPNWRSTLIDVATKYKLDTNRVEEQTDLSRLPEGLYVKWEDDDVVKGRYKYVRKEFIQHLQESDEHWMDRPIVPNQLAPGVDIFV